MSHEIELQEWPVGIQTFSDGFCIFYSEQMELKAGDVVWFRSFPGVLRKWRIDSVEPVEIPPSAARNKYTALSIAGKRIL